MNNINKLPVMKLVTPAMKKIIEDQLASASNFDTDASLEVLRNNYELERAFWNKDEEFVMANMVDNLICHDGLEVKTRIYTPQVKSNNLIYFIHGGGWVVGSNNTHDRIMRALADLTSATVIGIDYSLSPEAKFPTAIIECAKVIEYYTLNRKQYDLENCDIYFAGDSAGANMCVGTYLYLKDNDIANINVSGMLLYYGLYGLKDSVSRALLGGPWDGLTAEDLIFYNKTYLRKDEDIENSWFTIFNADLSVFPPTFIASCELDPLKDDSVALHKIISINNNLHQYKDYKGVIHGFLHYSKVLPEAMEALQDGALFIKSLKD